jgi:hypothetical protein
MRRSDTPEMRSFIEVGLYMTISSDVSEMEAVHASERVPVRAGTMTSIEAPPEASVSQPRWRSRTITMEE